MLLRGCDGMRWVIGSAATREMLDRSWDEVEQSLAEYRAMAESTVVRWSWCGPDAHFWELREPVAGDEAPARFLATDPGSEKRARYARFGYDADGNIVLAQRFTDHWEGRFGGTQRGVVLYEFVWSGGVLLRFRHERHGTDHHRVLLESVARHVADDFGRVSDTCSWGRDASSRTRYEWEDDVLASAVVQRFDGALGDENALVKRSRRTYERDESGLLRVRWTTEFDKHFPDVVGDTGVSWFRRSPGGLLAARRTIDRELPRRILAWVRRVAPAEPVYGLGLVWSLDAPALPPSLGLGTVKELAAWRARHGSGGELRSYAWNPAEFAHFDPLPQELTGDPNLDDAYALLNHDWELGETDREPAATLRRCAKTLLATDWSSVLTTHPRFAVFVVADELDDTLTKQLRATVPADLQRAIERGTT